MRVCAIIPAYDAERDVGQVARGTLALAPLKGAVFVVDDGSRDQTAEIARATGATVLSHRKNQGKGAALRTGMEHALAAGFDVAITIDADGQHPPAEALQLIEADADPEALVLGIRDLAGAGAPRANQISNGISNFFLSLFAGRRFADTQCGLRRYPLKRTLALRPRDDGYAFEAEVILRAVSAGMRLVETPIRVIYPPEGHRLTHFDNVRDPAKIVLRVLSTLTLTRGLPAQAPFERAKAPAEDTPAHHTPPPPPRPPARSSQPGGQAAPVEAELEPQAPRESVAPL